MRLPRHRLRRPDCPGRPAPAAAARRGTDAPDRPGCWPVRSPRGCRTVRASCPSDHTPPGRSAPPSASCRTSWDSRQKPYRRRPYGPPGRSAAAAPVRAVRAPLRPHKPCRWPDRAWCAQCGRGRPRCGGQSSPPPARYCRPAVRPAVRPRNSRRDGRSKRSVSCSWQTIIWPVRAPLRSDRQWH